MKAGTVPQERKGERFQPLAAGVPRETLATAGDGRSKGTAKLPPGGLPGRLAGTELQNGRPGIVESPDCRSR